MSSTRAADATSTPRLTGATAVVTGASRGIGLAIARALLDSGARVAMLARTEATLTAAARALGADALAVTCDVSSEPAVRAAVARVVDAYGDAPDILVNNAGTFRLAPIDVVDPNAFAAALETNLVAPFRLIHAFLPRMRSRGSGHVVTIGSVADRHVFAENASYAPGKFGARALHEALRLETKGSGLRTTLVSPGPVDTPLWDAVGPDARADLSPRTAMLRADAVAAAVLYAVTQPPDVNVDELRLSRA